LPISGSSQSIQPLQRGGVEIGARVGFLAYFPDISGVERKAAMPMRGRIGSDRDTMALATARITAAMSERMTITRKQDAE
jgi:hypothetical protein